MSDHNISDYRNITLVYGLCAFSIVFLASMGTGYFSIIVIPVFYLFIFFISETAAIAIIFYFIVTTGLFQWAIMRLSFVLHGQLDLTGNVIYVKGALFYLFVGLLLIPMVKNVRRVKIALILFIALILISLLRSPNLLAGTLYILNTWLPCLTLLAWCLLPVQQKVEKIARHSIPAIGIFYTVLLIYSIFWVLNLDNMISWELSPFINYHRTGDINDFFIGNTTKLFGSTFYRNASLVMDPIVAGYFLAQFSFISIILKKYTISSILLIFLLFTVSKGAFLLLLLSLIFYKTFTIASFRFNILLAVGIITGLIIIALMSQGKNSSYLHVLGLIYPFLPPLDLNYVIGHNISSGGGLTGSGSLGLLGGMESLVGTLQYQLGLVGIVMYLFIFIKVLHFKYGQADEVARLEFAVLMPSFINSFLQENAFNMPFIIIKIFGVIYFIRYISTSKRLLKYE